MQVLHGSKFDVLWLQRDFGLYLVNVFDTGEAARVLKYASFGLAHLLDLFCKVKAQKQFQVGFTLVSNRITSCVRCRLLLVLAAACRLEAEAHSS